MEHFLLMWRLFVPLSMLFGGWIFFFFFRGDKVAGRTAGCSWSLKSELFLRHDSHDEASLASSPQSGLILQLMLTLLFTPPSVERYNRFRRLVIMDGGFMGIEDNKGRVWFSGWGERKKRKVLWPACKLSSMSSNQGRHFERRGEERILLSLNSACVMIPIVR